MMKKNCQNLVVYTKCQKTKITVRTETTRVLPLDLLASDVVGTVDVGFTSVDLVNPEYFGFFPIFTFEVVSANEVVLRSVDACSVVSTFPMPVLATIELVETVGFVEVSSLVVLGLGGTVDVASPGFIVEDSVVVSIVWVLLTVVEGTVVESVVGIFEVVVRVVELVVEGVDGTVDGSVEGIGVLVVFD
jgi:hypothetical protein